MSIFSKFKRAREAAHEQKTTATQQQTKPGPVPYNGPPSYATQDWAFAAPLKRASNDLEATTQSAKQRRAASSDSHRATRRSTYQFPSPPCMPSSSQPPPGPNTHPSSTMKRANSDLSITSVMQHSQSRRQRHSLPVRGRQQERPNYGHQNYSGHLDIPPVPPLPLQLARHSQSSSKKSSMVIKRSTLSHVSLAEDLELDEEDEPSSASSYASAHSAASSISSKTADSVLNSGSKHTKPYRISLLPHIPTRPATSASSQRVASLPQFPRPPSQMPMLPQISVSLAKNSRTMQMVERQMASSSQSVDTAAQPSLPMPSSPSWLSSPIQKPTSARTPTQVRSLSSPGNSASLSAPSSPRTRSFSNNFFSMSDVKAEKALKSMSRSDIIYSASTWQNDAPPQTSQSMFDHKANMPVAEGTPLQSGHQKHDSVIQAEQVRSKSRSRKSISALFFRRSVTASAS